MPGRGRALGAMLGAAGLVLVDCAPGQAGIDALVTRHRLANGLTVLVRESDAVPTVAITLGVRAGSRYETPEMAGLTNFLHRVMLRGTRQHTATTLAQAAEDIGGGIDVVTDADYAAVQGMALGRHWRALLDLVAEVVLEPRFDPGEIEKERRLILSQIQTRQDDPFPHAFDALLSHLFAPHPYSLPAIGRRGAVDRLDGTALRREYERVYQPSGMVLAVSGAVRARAVIRAVEQRFGAMPSGVIRVEGPRSTPEPSGTRHVVERPAQQAQILGGYLAPPMAHPDYAAVKVLSGILGGGMAGRLFAELRDKRGLAYTVGTSYPSRADASFFLVHAGTAPASAEATEALLLHEVERIRREPVSGDELARAKGYLLGGLAMDRRTNARHAWYLAFFEIASVGYDFVDRYARAVEVVTADDVQRVARTYLTSGSTVVLRPPSGPRHEPCCR
jgi:predicted Zn-dependent peptidase